MANRIHSIRAPSDLRFIDDFWEEIKKTQSLSKFLAELTLGYMISQDHPLRRFQIDKLENEKIRIESELETIKSMPEKWTQYQASCDEKLFENPRFRKLLSFCSEREKDKGSPATVKDIGRWFEIHLKDLRHYDRIPMDEQKFLNYYNKWKDSQGDTDAE